MVEDDPYQEAAMYGTVAKIRVKPGRMDDVKKLNEEWKRDYMPKVQGTVGSLIYELDNEPDTLVLCAVFESKESYSANADSPDQDEWYTRFRDCMAGDPEWMDGQVVDSTF